MTCIRRAEGVALLAHLAYSKLSIVLADGLPIESATGIQQDDPLRPLLFDLVVNDAARTVKSKFNVWYIDDATISDAMDTVVTDFQYHFHHKFLMQHWISSQSFQVEVINVNYPEHHFSKVMQDILTSLTGAKEINADVTILGSPIESAGVRRCLEKSCS